MPVRLRYRYLKKLLIKFMLQIWQYNNAIPLPNFLSYPLYAKGYQEELLQLYNEFEIPLDSMSTNSDWAIALEADSSVVLKTRIFKEGEIPNVKGMGARDAVYVLENLGLKVTIKGRGFVREQSVLPGTRAVKGRQITLRLSV